MLQYKLGDSHADSIRRVSYRHWQEVREHETLSICIWLVVIMTGCVRFHYTETHPVTSEIVKDAVTK